MWRGHKDTVCPRSKQERNRKERTSDGTEAGGDDGGEEGGKGRPVEGIRKSNSLQSHVAGPKAIQAVVRYSRITVRTTCCNVPFLGELIRVERTFLKV